MKTRSTVAILSLILPTTALAAGGSGIAGDPYLVGTCAEFDAMRSDLGAHYRLTADIDCAAFGNLDPIGSDASPFTGELDGNEFAAYDIHVDSSASSVGVFGTTNGAYIHNFYTEQSSFHSSASAPTGGIVGRALNTTIYQVQTDSPVSSPGGIAGGIVGFADASTFVNVVANNDVSGDQAGGFVGTFTQEGTGTGYAGADFYRCGTTSNVIATTRGGGFAAYVEDATVIETSAIGDVSGGAGTLAMGGGWAAATRRTTITDSYSWGAVTATTPGGFIAGPIGDLTLTNVYALGSVATDPHGLFVYLDFESEPGTYTATNTLYISHADQQSGAADVYYDASTPPLDQWDFVNIWVETNLFVQIFPRLQMAQATEPGAPGSGGGLVCDQGAPYDWDGNGMDDGCRGDNVVIDPTVTIPAGTRIGDDVTIEAYVSVGNNLVVGTGSFIAARATLGGGNTLGDGVIIGRRANISDDNTFGANTTVGRAVRMDDGNVLGAFSSLGYASVVGSNVVVTGSLVLGSLAEIGHLNGSGDIQVSGSITIARAARVATDPPSTLIAGDGVVIGPESSVGTGSTLGDGVRMRKNASIGANATVGEDVRIGRDVDVGAGVTLDADANVGANATLCDTSGSFGGSIDRGYSDPVCAPLN